MDLPAAADALGNPLAFLLTPGQAHDLVGADALLPQMAADLLVAGNAFDADKRDREPHDQGMDFCAQPAAAVADRLIIIFFWGRLRCADGPEQWCCRSWRTRCRHRRPDAERCAPTRRSWPSG